MTEAIVAHNWSATAPLDPDRDIENIPGLNSDGSKVYGPWDAVEVYLQRGSAKFVRPKDVRTIPNLATVLDELRPFQQRGVSWILNMWKHVGSALLADEMGLGKTAQVITAASIVSLHNHLVVCPRSVCMTWEREIAKWGAKNPKVQILRTRDEAATARPSRASWTIISYELLPYLASHSYTTVIIDEAHNFAGRKAKRGKRLEHFCALAENRIGITGTPIWSRPRDYWMLFRVLFGSTFGNSFDFDIAYCGGQLNEHGGLDNKSATRIPELKFRTRFYQLRRMKKNVASEMPELTRTVRWLDADPKATAAMKSAYLHRNKGAQYRALAATLEAKMIPAMEAAADAKQFLLFTWQKKHAQYMQQELEKNGTPCHLITGDVSPKKRNALIALAAKQRHGIVCTIDTLKEGVDGLQHVASVAIFHALDFVPLKLLQAEKRLDRLGQKSPVTIIYLCLRESMDEWVNETVVQKLAQWEGLVQGSETSLKKGLQGRKGNQTEADLETEVLKSIYLAQKKAA